MKLLLQPIRTDSPIECLQRHGRSDVQVPPLRTAAGRPASPLVRWRLLEALYAYALVRLDPQSGPLPFVALKLTCLGISAVHTQIGDN